MQKKEITIVAGHDTDEQRENRTLLWLAQHGAHIDKWNGLLMITISGGALAKGVYQGEYVVGFDMADGQQEQSSLTISLEPNIYDTHVYVEFSGDFGCTCRGYGCVKCCEELAALERGENPYAHHTAIEWQLGDRARHRNAEIGGKVVLVEPEYITIKLDGIGEVRHPKTEVVQL
jgi:hypothetical protein